jgi:hypothetical protein
MRKFITVLLACILLSACGGGGGGSDPTPQPTPTPPPVIWPLNPGPDYQQHEPRQPGINGARQVQK